jgi:hypothetical protein
MKFGRMLDITEACAKEMGYEYKISDISGFPVIRGDFYPPDVYCPWQNKGQAMELAEKYGISGVANDPFTIWDLVLRKITGNKSGKMELCDTEEV